MKIKLKTRYAGPRGCFEPDTVLDLPPADAKNLLDGGYAVEYTAAKPPLTQPPKPEVNPEAGRDTGGEDAKHVVKLSADKQERKK